MLKIRATHYNWKTANQMEAGLYINELRIRLANATHIAITVTKISDFNLSLRLILKKLFSFHFFQSFPH